MRQVHKVPKTGPDIEQVSSFYVGPGSSEAPAGECSYRAALTQQESSPTLDGQSLHPSLQLREGHMQNGRKVNLGDVYPSQTQ